MLDILHNLEPCPSCDSTRINLVRMPEHSKHYAARRCAECDSFRSWEPKPVTQQKLQQQETVNHLLKSPQLTQWEKTFLEGLRSKKLSPKQQEVLNRIENKVGGQG